MFFFFSSRRRHTRCSRDWSSDVCSSDLDRYQANGLPGANGIADVLDEARWGLEWLLEMYPEDDLLLNRSEEHTSELQSRLHLVCRLLLEKKKKKKRRSLFTETKHNMHQLCLIETGP